LNPSPRQWDQNGQGASNYRGAVTDQQSPSGIRDASTLNAKPPAESRASYSQYESARYDERPTYNNGNYQTYRNDHDNSRYNDRRYNDNPKYNDRRYNENQGYNANSGYNNFPPEQHRYNTNNNYNSYPPEQHRYQYNGYRNAHNYEADIEGYQSASQSETSGKFLNPAKFPLTYKLQLITAVKMIRKNMSKATNRTTNWRTKKKTLVCRRCFENSTQTQTATLKRWATSPNKSCKQLWTRCQEEVITIWSYCAITSVVILVRTEKKWPI
jgi:hypothetical protein